MRHRVCPAPLLDTVMIQLDLRRDQLQPMTRRSFTNILTQSHQLKLQPNLQPVAKPVVNPVLQFLRQIISHPKTAQIPRNTRSV